MVNLTNAEAGGRGGHASGIGMKAAALAERPEQLTPKMRHAKGRTQ
jgi:alkanesulfonate monooxygenase SsuD/methylene tetrahydromethanopterin reductase-like flavin-dependent oxidoreductase (luciferase family)